ncbi:sensor histidine kinase [Burkholderiaceae bacterium UC74_6]
MNAAVPPSRPPLQPTPYQRWQAFAANAVRYFHIYASWLVSISWKRFVLLAAALTIGVNIAQKLPPFSWKISDEVIVDEPAEPAPPPAMPKRRDGKPVISLDKPIHYDVTIDEKGIRIAPRGAASAASAAASDAASDSTGSDLPSISIQIPHEDADKAKAELEKAAEEVRKQFEEQVQDAANDAKEAAEEMRRSASRRPTVHHEIIRLGDPLDELALAWVLASIIIKATYKGRIVAEKKAAKAAETAEAEQLRRQVVEARMAAMQAQVEPHFLFNTLASIDHLIETDPARASQMQKNLIALLRASMPTMREANATGVRDLGRELAVIRPYLEILKVRMEERLVTTIDVPEGLHSAEFPPMMIQSLVENAIKHGLEPKAEGGSLTVKAEIVHGKLVVCVADTGLGFGRAATAGTGVGLANIRERLNLLYGGKASVTVAENQPSGTRVTITVPYVAKENAA